MSNEDRSFPCTSSRIFFCISAACSFATASASILASQASAAVGFDRPEDWEGDVFPLVPAADFLIISIAFATATFDPSSAKVSLAAIADVGLALALLYNISRRLRKQGSSTGSQIRAPIVRLISFSAPGYC